MQHLTVRCVFNIPVQHNMNRSTQLSTSAFGYSTFMLPFALMRTMVIIAIFMGLTVSPVKAQDDVRSGISYDLCTCFDRINPEIGDAQFERAMRNCLENALLNNPDELNKMVKLREGTNHKGFSIGQWLGSILQNDCPSFKQVQERMKGMQMKLTYYGNQPLDRRTS